MAGGALVEMLVIVVLLVGLPLAELHWGRASRSARPVGGVRAPAARLASEATGA